MWKVVLDYFLLTTFYLLINKTLKVSDSVANRTAICQTKKPSNVHSYALLGFYLPTSFLINLTGSRRSSYTIAGFIIDNYAVSIEIAEMKIT